MKWIKDLLVSSRVRLPGCSVCSEYAQFWLISLFSLLRCGPASNSIGGCFQNQGVWDDTAAGGATQVSTGTAELGAFGKAEGGEERCEESNMPQHMKGLVDHSLWGDWIQRRRPLAGHNKDGLYCKKDTPGRIVLDWELPLDRAHF